jgi:hypothetical protein
MLALSSDPAWKALAVDDLEGATGHAEQMELGDRWWNLAEKEEGAAKSSIQGRAAHWYQKALPGLTGVVKDKVNKRLAESGPVTNGVNLLKLLRLSKHVVSGKWRFDGESLLTPAGGRASILLPYLPPPEYDLRLEVERLTGSERLNICLVCGAGQGVVVLDRGGSEVAVIYDHTNGRRKVSAHPHVFTNGKPQTILCSVRAGKVTVVRDGEMILRCKCDFREFKRRSEEDLVKMFPDPRYLYIGLLDDPHTTFRVSEITLLPASEADDSTQR